MKRGSGLAAQLVESFILLPPSGVKLTDQQLDAIFGGDMSASCDLAQLAHQSNVTAE